MIDTEFHKHKLSIVADALQLGLEIAYKNGWYLFFRNGELYQANYEFNNGQPIIHKSAVGLNEFIKFSLSLNLEEIKKIYGDSRLISLQNKLLEKDKEQNE